MSVENTIQIIDRYLRGTKTEADPQPMVAEWFDSFFDLLYLAETDSPEEAYDLVASWSRLWRVPATLIQAVTDQPVGKLDVDRTLWTELLEVPSAEEQEHERRFRQRLPELAELAIQVPRPLEWIQEFQEFDQRSEAELEPEAATAWAIDLLEDLDTAELVWWAASRFGSEEIGKLRRRKKIALEMALASLKEWDYLFTPARKWIVAFAQATSEIRDPALEYTLRKVPPLLEVVLDFEGSLQPADWQPYVEAARQILQVASERTGPTPVSPSAQQEPLIPILEFLVQADLEKATPALAAADKEKTQDVPLTQLRWISPDKKWIARVRLSQELSVADAPKFLPLVIVGAVKVGEDYHPDDENVCEQKQRVRLWGVEGKQVQPGQFHFSPQELLAAAEKHPQQTLEVEEEGRWVPWQRFS